jgi:hypothetical protein
MKRKFIINRKNIKLERDKEISIQDLKKMSNTKNPAQINKVINPDLPSRCILILWDKLKP